MRNEDHDEDRREYRRRSSDQPSFVKNLGVTIVSISIVGTIFTAGYNWRSVTLLWETQQTNEERFVHKDVAKEQYDSLVARLAELSRQLEEIRQEQVRARAERSR